VETIEVSTRSKAGTLPLGREIVEELLESGRLTKKAAPARSKRR
jgi:hypothetical protein